MGKGLLTLLAALAAVVLFVALNIVSTAVLRGARADLTENRLYTLTSGSRAIAGKLEEPIRLTLYFSEKAANDLPDIRSYAQRVEEMLREFQRASGGKIRLDVVDPLPFSPEQDEADQAGLIGAPTGRGTDRLYFGLVGTNATDQRQVIPLFSPRGEQFLEYDVTRLIHLLSNPKKATIGLLSRLPIEGSGQNPMMQRGTPPWIIHTQMRDLFEIKTIAPDATTIPPEVTVLMVVHPKNLSDAQLYAIDQFVMRGGRLLALVDPWCEADTPPGLDPMQAMGIPRASDLKRLFDAWGIEMAAERVVGDRKNALRVTIGSQSRPEVITYLPWMGLGPESIDRADAVTGQLQSVTLATAGSLRKKDGASITFEPLLTSSAESMLVNVQEIQFIPDPKKLLAGFAPSGDRYVMAARVSGTVSSAFPQGDPSAPAPSEGEAKPGPDHLAQSKEPIQAIIIADADMLADRFWVQEERLGGISLGARKVADNGDLVIQSLDNLGGSSELISVRARGSFARPFEKVREIQRDAEQQFRAKEQELQTRLSETEQKLQELRRQRPETGGALLTPEQRAEIDKFQRTLVDTRKELREVQFQLEKDVQALGNRLRAINIGLVPLLVGAFALGLAAYRANRRRGYRREAPPAGRT